MATLEQRPAQLPHAPSLMFHRLFCFPAALCAVLAATVVAVARKGFTDPDIWWHLRNVQCLFATHKWLRVDAFSFTVRGQPWIDHEWLAEIPYYVAWRGFGVLGVKVLSLLILESIFGGLLYLCWRQSGHIKASACACYLAVLLGSVSFGPRTLLFGYIYLIVLLLVLEEFPARSPAPLWVLPPLFCLWINTHGSWALGLIVFVIFIAGGFFEGRWGAVEATPWSPMQLRRLLRTLVISVAALFLNPYGYRLVLYPLDMAFRQKLNIAHVAEWSSVDFHDFRGKIALVFVFALLLGALLGRSRWRLHEVGFVLFGMYAALTYVRFLFLAGILAAPLIARLLSFLPPYRPEIDRPAFNLLILAGALAFMACGFPTTSQLWRSIDREYPEEAVSTLMSLPPSDHVLNFYLWGGYLGWADPQYRDFIDSRVDVFERAGVLQDYLDLISLKDPDAALDKYRIRYVLFPPDEPLSYVLLHDARWRVAFRGSVSILFERVKD